MIGSDPGFRARSIVRRAGLLACVVLACSDPTGTEALDLAVRASRGEVITFELTQMGEQREAPFVTLELMCTGQQLQRDEIVSERYIFGPGSDARWERHVRWLRSQGDGSVTATDLHDVRIGKFSGQRDESGPYLLVGLRREDQFDWFGVELRPRGQAFVVPQTTGGSCLGDSQQFRMVEKYFRHS